MPPESPGRNIDQQLEDVDGSGEVIDVLVVAAEATAFVPELR